MNPSILFNGVDFWGADVLISSGAKPSTTVLFGSYDQSYDTEPKTLYISTEQSQIQIPGMYVVNTQNRPVRWKGVGESQIVLEDRRRQWWRTFSTYRCNLLRSDGGRINQKDCRTIFFELLSRVGEANAITIFASTLLYPTMDYPKNTSVGQMLEDLCRRTKHTIGFAADGRVGVYPLGTGYAQAIPQDGSTLKSFQQRTETKPGNFTAVSAPTIFESEITLAARAMEEDGELVPLADASYKPVAGWGGQWPGQYAGVAADKQWLAMRSLYKVFVEADIANDEATADSTLTGTPVYINDKMGVWNSSESSASMDKVTGVFWPETHRGDLNSGSTDIYQGSFEIRDGVFYFDRPVFKVSAGSVAEPELKAIARHKVVNLSGQYSCEKVGVGPEVVADWVVPVIRHGIGTNVAQVESELNAFKVICDFEANLLSGCEVHGDIIPIDVNGRARVVRYKVGADIASSGFADTEIYWGSGWEGLEI